jgi:deazaflavin-dependent oxidoreductase (nitroreductase family)
MPEPGNWNQQIIDEFRANGGKAGGNFADAPLILVHHIGRKSSKEYVNPLVYLPKEGDDDTTYIFASKAGAPVDPDWYHNLLAAGQATVEVGTETYPVAVTEITGDERDRIYDEQVRHMPGFGDYAIKTEGIRKIPVLELKRRR